MNLYKKYILPRILESRMKTATEDERSSVVASVHGTVLEVGFGSGMNLPYYKNVSKIYALEPSQEFYKFAAPRVKNAVFPVEHLKASAEKIPLPDNSVDFAVSTWSLCSVPRIEKCLAEIHRVLKPGGKFSFIEHGRSPEKVLAIIQKILNPISKACFGGCRLNREMDKLIAAAGFEIHDLFKQKEESGIFGFTYKGVAVKR